MGKVKRWMLYGDELYYSGHGRGPAYYIIDTGEVEIHLDKNGEILDLVIKNARKYLDPEEIKEIADIVEKPPTTDTHIR